MKFFYNLEARSFNIQLHTIITYKLQITTIYPKYLDSLKKQTVQTHIRLLLRSSLIRVCTVLSVSKTLSEIPFLNAKLVQSPIQKIVKLSECLGLIQQ